MRIDIDASFDLDIDRIADEVIGNIDLDEIARLAAEQIDTSDITNEVAANLDVEDIASYVSLDDLAGYIDLDDLAERVANEVETPTPEDLVDEVLGSNGFHDAVRQAVADALTPELVASLLVAALTPAPTLTVVPEPAEAPPAPEVGTGYDRTRIAADIAAAIASARP